VDDAYASPGKRTSGTAAPTGRRPPGWTGTLPQGVERIDSPTAYNWSSAHQKRTGPRTYAAVNEFQDGFRSRRSRSGKPAAAPAAFVPMRRWT